MNATFFIHFAIFIPFGIMAIRLSKAQHKLRIQQKYDNKLFLERYADQYVEGFRMLKKVSNIVPRSMLIVGILLAVYVPINFILFIARMSDGSPTEVNGRYYLNNHGVHTRELTREEYAQYQAYEVRGFSGHWMVFSFVPFVYFVYIEKNIRKSESSDLQLSNG
jgi:hypothetical protein